MEEHKLFDEQFGKSGPEMNCDSIGRWAGCDDCHENIKLREEHKSFLIKSNIRTKIKFIEEEVERLDNKLKDDYYGKGGRDCLYDQIQHLTTIKQTLLEELNK